MVQCGEAGMARLTEPLAVPLAALYGAEGIGKIVQGVVPLGAGCKRRHTSVRTSLKKPAYVLTGVGALIRSPKGSRSRKALSRSGLSRNWL